MESSASRPLVTVYMPTHNRLSLLRRAVDSVLNQDYKNIELIVVNDNSSDGTAEYLKNLTINDPRVSYYSNDSNEGACACRNKAIFNAKGEYITGLDDDDYFLHNRISSFIEKWSEETDKKVIGLYSNAKIITSASSLLPTRKKAVHHHDLLIFNDIGNQIFTKTEYLRLTGGFNTKMPAWQDLEAWYNLLKTLNGKFLLVNNFSYIVDQSHPHERISNKKISLIFQAYNNFIGIHKLSERETNRLKCQLLPYQRGSINVLLVLRIIWKARHIKTTKNAVKNYLASLLIKRWLPHHTSDSD